MNHEQHALLKIAEEAGEVAMAANALAQRAMKAMQFSLEEAQEGQPTNEERLKSEWDDLVGAMSHLEKTAGLDVLDTSFEAVQNKEGKILKYRRYSEELGQVKDS